MAKTDHLLCIGRETKAQVTEPRPPAFQKPALLGIGNCQLILERSEWRMGMEVVAALTCVSQEGPVGIRRLALITTAKVGKGLGP